MTDGCSVTIWNWDFEMLSIILSVFGHGTIFAHCDFDHMEPLAWTWLNILHHCFNNVGWQKNVDCYG